LNGLSNTLIEGVSFERIAQRNEIENLDVIPSGPVPPNPSELLSSNQFKKILTEAYENYDMIIVDSPPMLAVTDAQILASLVDGVAIVARSGMTEIYELKEAVGLVEKVQGNLLGTILNDVDKDLAGDYYYYGN